VYDRAHLSNAELRRLLSELPFAAPQDGGASHTSTRLDLYSAVLGIDRLRPGRRQSVLDVLCDFDDGSEDGFEKSDVIGDGCPSTVSEAKVVVTCTDKPR
jgi:hypothetical protein